MMGSSMVNACFGGMWAVGAIGALAVVLGALAALALFRCSLSGENGGVANVRSKAS